MANEVVGYTQSCDFNPLPYYPPATNYFSTNCYPQPQPYFPCKIRKAENGFIVEMNGKEMVFDSVKKLTEYLAKELGDK